MKEFITTVAVQSKHSKVPENKFERYNILTKPYEKGYNDKDYERCLAVVRRNRDYEDGWNDWYYGRYVRTFDE